MSSTMWLQGLAVGMDLLIGSHMPALNRDSVRNYMYNIYRCKDGSWLRISNPQPEAVLAAVRGGAGDWVGFG